MKSLTALDAVDLIEGLTFLALVIVVDVILPSVLMSLPIIVPLGLIVNSNREKESQTCNCPALCDGLMDYHGRSSSSVVS